MKKLLRLLGYLDWLGCAAVFAVLGATSSLWWAVAAYLAAAGILIAMIVASRRQPGRSYGFDKPILTPVTDALLIAYAIWQIIVNPAYTAALAVCIAAMTIDLIYWIVYRQSKKRTI